MPTLTLPQRKHMKKTITVTDRNGTFEGYVEVLFNHRSQEEDRRIPCTESKLKFFHIVKGQADQLSWVSDEFTNKEDSIFQANKMEQLVRKHLSQMATEIIATPDSVEDNLKNLGYL